MHDQRRITERRINRILNERIKPAVYSQQASLEVEAIHLPGEPIPFTELDTESFEPFEVGKSWGPAWGTTWFRFGGIVPESFAGERVEALIDLGFIGPWVGFQAEGMVYRDGRPVHGIHPTRKWTPITARAEGGERIEFYLEAAANPTLGMSHLPSYQGDINTASDAPIYSLNQAALAVLDEHVYRLVLELEMLINLSRTLPSDRPRRPQILAAMEAAIDALDVADVSATAADARKCLSEVLATPAASSAHRLYGIGHAHIDTAWLWPLRETKRKCMRTFSSAVRMMDDYPEYKFGCSQAAQYEWIQEAAPELFEEIVAKAETGQWVPIGSMWVEADANLAGGEALVRQFLYGQKFFAEHFGEYCQEVWIPDVFGYAASLPQIMKLAGARWFLTQKMSWNRTNRFPHHSFMWEGIDGTAIFTHFPPIETYNSEVQPNEFDHAVKTYTDHGKANCSLVPFGHGDGGGGPTREMLERARLLADLEGSPKFAIASPAEFFEIAEAEVDDWPTWVGELYLEMHRGTLTSQAKTKAGNRRCENLLREAEWLSVAVMERTAEHWGRYDELERLWKDTLLLQFHDILPGSSIAWVHREAEEEYERITGALEEIIAEALHVLGEGQPAGMTAFNPAPVDVSGVVLEHPSEQNPGQREVVGWGELPAGGFGALGPMPPDVAPVVVVGSDDGLTVTNELVELGWDGLGKLIKFKHVETGRDIADSGSANVLEIYEDLPIEYDAWDIEEYYRKSRQVLQHQGPLKVLEAGPLCARVQLDYDWNETRLTQFVEVRAGSNRVDFVTVVDWQEQEKMLKVAFDVGVRAHEAAYEIQYGHTFRPTHSNTSWDAAKFEVCGHRWADLSEPSFGVALLNDSKYGYDISGSEMRLTLLRSARYPDPEADRGDQVFTYSVLPHVGDHIEGQVAAAGYILNMQPRVVGIDLSTFESPVVVGEGILVEAIKLAEDGSGDLIVRCYEPHGNRVTADLSVPNGYRSPVLCDLLEQPLSPDDPRSEGASLAANGLELHPFKIATLRYHKVGPGEQVS